VAFLSSGHSRRGQQTNNGLKRSLTRRVAAQAELGVRSLTNRRTNDAGQLLGAGGTEWRRISLALVADPRWDPRSG
jgi:hypothetical protein